MPHAMMRRRRRRWALGPLGRASPPPPAPGRGLQARRSGERRVTTRSRTMTKSSHARSAATRFAFALWPLFVCVARGGRSPERRGRLLLLLFCFGFCRRAAGHVTPRHTSAPTCGCNGSRHRDRPRSVVSRHTTHAQIFTPGPGPRWPKRPVVVQRRSCIVRRLPSSIFVAHVRAVNYKSDR